MGGDGIAGRGDGNTARGDGNAARDGGTPGFRLVSERRQFDGHVFSVGTVTVADPDGCEFDRDVVHHPGAVSIVAVHEDRTVTLVRQFRAAVGEALLELPAGTRDVDGEAPEATARRELAEEAGLAAGQLRRLASVANAPGSSDQRTILFLATAMVPCATAPVGVEERWMTVERVPLDDVERLVAEGRLVDATTIIGLLLARSALGGGAGGGGAGGPAHGT